MITLLYGVDSPHKTDTDLIQFHNTDNKSLDMIMWPGLCIRIADHKVFYRSLYLSLSDYLLTTLVISFYFYTFLVWVVKSCCIQHPLYTGNGLLTVVLLRIQGLDSIICIYDIYVSFLFWIGNCKSKVCCSRVTALPLTVSSYGWASS